MRDGVRIIDGHCHVASTRFIPRAFFEGIAGNIAASMQAKGQAVPPDKIIQMLEKNHQDHEADQLVAEMDEAGIEKCLLLLPDFTYCMDLDLSIEEMYELHYKILEKHANRFILFAGVDPRWGERALKLFRNGVRDLCVSGLKLYPPCGYSPSDPKLFPFYGLCNEYGLPVLVHTGATSPVLPFRFGDVALIDDAALRFPGVNFILAHAGVNSVQAAAELCRFRPNVFMDISGFTTIRKPGGWQGHLRGLFRLELNHKILFGTDWPIAGLKESTSDIVNRLFADDGPCEGLCKTDIENIASGNLLRLLVSSSNRSRQMDIYFKSQGKP